MAIICVSPEGAMQQVSSTEAEALKKLGWKEMSYEEFYAKAKAKNSPKPVTTVDLPNENSIMSSHLAKRVGRPRKEDGDFI